jgi:hypothetical protein
VSKSCQKKEIQHIKMGVSIGWPQSQKCIKTRENCTSYYQSERTREDLDGIQNHTKTHFAHLLAPAQPQLPKFHILLEKIQHI